MGDHPFQRARIAPLLAVALLTMGSAGPSADRTDVVPAKVCDGQLLSGTDPVGTGQCPGVRPGAILWTAQGQCTFNFVFKGSDGHRYIGSAGHCILDEPAEKAWRPGQGPKAKDASLDHIGGFVYALLEPGSPALDFSLVRVKRDVKVDPQMCVFGGPTGLNDDITEQPVRLHWYGNGGVIGWEPVTGVHTVPARSAVATRGMTDPKFVDATGPVFFGDSGSGAISNDGRAVGVLAILRFSNGHTVGLTRIRPQVERAEKVLGIQLKLQTARQLRPI